MLFDAFFFVAGAVVAVVVPKVYTFVKTKIVAPAEAKIASVEVEAKAIVAEAEKKV